MPRNHQAISYGAAGADPTPVSSTNPLPTAASGGVASGATDSGNPVKVAGKVNTTLPTFTDGQRADLQVSTKGYLLASSGLNSANVDGNANIVIFSKSVADVAAPLAIYGSAYNGSTWDRMRGDTNGIVVQPGLSSTFWNYAAASGGIDNTTTAVTIKAAAGASVRNYLKTLTIGHDTLGAATEFAVRDGAGGTVLWRGKLQTTAVEDKTITFDPPLKGTANTLLEVVTLTAVTGDVLVNATGYTGA